MASFTRSTVAGSTTRVPLMTCETVDIETPAARATSLILAFTFRPLPLGLPNSTIMGPKQA
jgi:hypothetical protein